MAKTTTLGIIVVIVVAVIAIGAYVAMQPSSPTTTTTTSTTTTSTTTTASWQDKLSDLKIGVIYTSPLDEPWGKSLHIALHEFENQYGNFAAYDYTEAVQIGDDERVLRMYADSGHQLIIAHSYFPSVPTLTKEYPNIPFVGSGGGMEPIWLYPDGIADPNYIHTQPLYQYSTYLMGEVAGRITKTNKIGYVSTFPVWNTCNAANGFIVGVKNANPDAEISVVWIEAWWDPVAAKSAAESMAASGVDVIFAEPTGAEAGAEAKGVYHFAYGQEYPTGVSDVVTVGYDAWNLRPFVYDYIHHWAVGDIMEWIADIDHMAYYPKFEGVNTVWRLDKFPEIPTSVADMVAEKTAAINNGTIVLQNLGSITPENLIDTITPEMITQVLNGTLGWP